eukprot:6457036-Amphidinium_carterae.2
MARLTSKSKRKQSVRWGNTIDVLIAANLFQVRLCVFDLRHCKYICDAQLPGPRLSIGFLDHHFVAGYVKQRRVRSKPMGWKWLPAVCLGMLGEFGLSTPGETLPLSSRTRCVGKPRMSWSYYASLASQWHLSCSNGDV